MAFEKKKIYLLNKVNGWLEIKSEVDKLPLDALTLILFLFEDKHCVVEQLLQLFVSVVNAQLLKTAKEKCPCLQNAENENYL